MRVTIVLAVLTFSFVLLGSCGNVLAVNDIGAVYIGESSIHPASPFYFLKAIREKIELALAGSNKVKAQRQLEFSQRRLREVNALVKNKRQDLIDSTLERYKAALSETENLVSQDEDLKIKVGEAVARHLDVLQRIYDQVGNPRAKQAIRAAIERDEKYNRPMACRFLAKEATASGLTETEKVFLGQKVQSCQKNLQENFKDELMELRQMKKTPPSSLTK